MKKILVPSIFLSLLISSSVFSSDLSQRNVLDLKTTQFEKIDGMADTVEVIKSISKKEIGLDDTSESEASESIVGLMINTHSGNSCSIRTMKTFDDSTDIVKKGHYKVASSNTFSGSLSILLQSEDSNVNSLFVECYSDSPRDVTLAEIQEDLKSMLKFN